jgi:hypothetical protein
MRGSPHTYPLRSELLTDSQERIASNILADRLQKLVKLGIIVKSHDPSHKQKVIGHGHLRARRVPNRFRWLSGRQRQRFPPFAPGREAGA